MQIDFHHGVTYICSRLAGFDSVSASIIAYSAQYVDDATNSGLIRFGNGALFSRMSSAHKMLDYRNFKELANYRVWIPFHFLPGNGGLKAGQNSSDHFVDRLICRPNSLVAQDMVRDCILAQGTPYHLHRLGIMLHVYVDTWAHQGFAGVNHPVNEAKKLLGSDGKPDKGLMHRLAGYFIGEALPLGHGAVLGNPDQPYLRWSYTNGYGQTIMRNNPEDFLAAAEHMFAALQRYRLKDPNAVVPGLPDRDRDLMMRMFETITDRDKTVRHQQWLNAIEQGKFSFGGAEVSYQAKGKGSWKYAALGTENAIDSGNEVFTYSPGFLASDWKRFHDALLAHHFYVIHELLPRYNICVA